MIITIPYPDDVINSDGNLDLTVDIGNIKLDPEYESNKCNSVFTYIRNVGFYVKCDFSNCDYNEKCNYINSYINIDMDSLCIPELNETLLCIISNEKLDNIHCIFDSNELKRYVNENIDKINEIRSFIVSVEDMLVYVADKTKRDIFADPKTINLKHITSKPSYYNIMVMLFRFYPILIDAIRIVFSKQVEHICFDYVYDCINSKDEYDMYLDILNLPSYKILTNVL